MLRDRYDVVFRAEPETLAAQGELLDLLWEHLSERQPDLYTFDNDTITIRPTRQKYARTDFHDRPLELASRLIQDDLVIMRASDRGHRLVAASLCFPSSWSLAEKFGHPLADIHRPVPGFQRGTRIADMIERIFTHLKTDYPVERFNWSLYDDPRLHYQERHHAAHAQMWNPDDPRAWIRVERQTLRRLPVSGDIVFTIKICVDPIAVLKRLPDGPRLAASFADQILALDRDQLAYKGMADTPMPTQKERYGVAAE